MAPVAFHGHSLRVHRARVTDADVIQIDIYVQTIRQHPSESKNNRNEVI